MEFLPAVYRAVQPEARADLRTRAASNSPPSNTRHFEHKHYSKSWGLDMHAEVSLPARC